MGPSTDPSDYVHFSHVGWGHRVPSPTGLTRWNIQRIPTVFIEVACHMHDSNGGYRNTSGAAVDSELDLNFYIRTMLAFQNYSIDLSNCLQAVLVLLLVPSSKLHIATYPLREHAVRTTCLQELALWLRRVRVGCLGVHLGV